MPEFRRPGYLPRAANLARVRRHANSFLIPGSGQGTIEISLQGNATNMAWIISPDPPADTDRKAIRIRLLSNVDGDHDQVELGVRNKTGYLQIANNTDAQYFRVDEDGVQFAFRSQVFANANATIANTTLGSWTAIHQAFVWNKINGGDIFARYDFSDSTTLTINSGIQQANDLSGNGNHLLQDDSAQRPTQGSLNGETTANCRAAATIGLENASLHAELKQPFTIMFPFTFDHLYSFERIFRGHSASRDIHLAANEDLYITFGTNLIYNSVANGAHIVTVVANGANSKIYVDGGTPTTGNAGTQNVNRFHVGFSSTETTGFDGEFGEFLVLNTEISDADQNSIGSHWGNKYNITWTNV